MEKFQQWIKNPKKNNELLKAKSQSLNPDTRVYG